METSMRHNLHNTLQSFKHGKLYSLPVLGKALNVKLERLPVSIRIVLESVLRNCDGKKVTEEHVRQLAAWQPNAKRTEEIPFVLARIVLQDFTGVPLLCDLAAMRGVAQKMGKDPKLIEPLVPVDLVVDHSVQIDHYGTKNALDINQKLEFKRNEERYQFMKWGMQAFDSFKVVPPGIGIVHQVNLEYLAPGVHKKEDGAHLPIYYPDTLVGTDSHTTMINGIGGVGWGVGAIDYSEELELDLSRVYPSLAGPKRPQDRIDLDKVKDSFARLFSRPVAENGFAKKPEELQRSYRTFDGKELKHGDVLIAAITSCTNTSNPGVLLAAGLLAKKAVERGLAVKPHIKTSLAPGSRVVTEYLGKAGLLPYLEKLGFNLAAYGCTTCIGNSGPLAQPIEEAVVKNDMVCAAVLSGNRNFEARIHPNI